MGKYNEDLEDELEKMDIKYEKGQYPDDDFEDFEDNEEQVLKKDNGVKDQEEAFKQADQESKSFYREPRQQSEDINAEEFKNRINSSKEDKDLKPMKWKYKDVNISDSATKKKEEPKKPLTQVLDEYQDKEAKESIIDWRDIRDQKEVNEKAKMKGKEFEEYNESLDQDLKKRQTDFYRKHGKGFNKGDLRKAKQRLLNRKKAK